MAIYNDDSDRERFLDLLTQIVHRYHWLCHAYCLMSNHYHLVLETPEGNLSQGMRQVNGIYTQGYNRRHGRVGHLFQGRYKAIVVEKESYLLALCRYVVLNPVRAGMVQAAQDYRWSSYRATAGQGPCPPWLCTDWILAQFGSERVEACRQYRRFVGEGVGGAAPWEKLKGQLFLGQEGFVERLRAALLPMRTLSEVPRQQRYADRPELSLLLEACQGRCKAERDRVICEAHGRYGYSLSVIGKALGLHYTTISKIVKARMSS
jgi:REP element-mobilizing transposase RayT